MWLRCCLSLLRIFNIGVGHNPQSLILFASFSILPHTKVHQANTSMINSSDFHLRRIKSASECAFESHVRSKPLKSFYFRPIISNYLVYPLNSEQVPLLHSVVHITLLKGKLILNYCPITAYFFTSSVSKISRQMLAKWISVSCHSKGKGQVLNEASFSNC